MNDLHAHKVKSNACHAFQNLLGRGKFKAFGNHSLHWVVVSDLLEIHMHGGLYPLLNGQLTPAHVIGSPLLFTMSLPLVLNGAYGHASDT